MLQRKIEGDFTFDSYFTSADVLNHIHGLERNYVGDLKLNRKVGDEGQEQKLSAVAQQIPKEAKKPMGLGECQVRSGEGQTRHVYLVSAAYSLLMRSLHRNRAQEWARKTLTTIGEACRAVRAETLGQLVDWMVDKLTRQHWSVLQIKTALAVP